MATLTYVYNDATAVLGPLATTAEPHTFDLCARHANNLTVPQGWQVIRLADQFVPAEPSDEDLEALAEVVRKAMREPRPQLTERPHSSWDGKLSPEAVIGSAQPLGEHYNMRDKQGISQPPAANDTPGQSDKRGHLRVIPGGLPD